MDFHWQTIAALGVVSWAASLLARRAWQAARGAASRSCGACSSCTDDVQVVTAAEIGETESGKSTSSAPRRAHPA